MQELKRDIPKNILPNTCIITGDNEYCSIIGFYNDDGTPADKCQANIDNSKYINMLQIKGDMI